MAVFELPFLTLIITTLAVAASLAVLMIFVRVMRYTKSDVDGSYKTPE